jgi:predicted kinase
MCGLSFSGKTTLARKIVEWLQCAYISLDEISAERGLWGGYGIPVEEWERTHALAASCKPGYCRAERHHGTGLGEAPK